MSIFTLTIMKDNSFKRRFFFQGLFFFIFCSQSGNLHKNAGAFIPIGTGTLVTVHSFIPPFLFLFLFLSIVLHTHKKSRDNKRGKRMTKRPFHCHTTIFVFIIRSNFLLPCPVPTLYLKTLIKKKKKRKQG